MNTQSSFLILAIACLLHLCGLPASAQDPVWHFEFTNGVPHKLVWQAENAKSYDLWQSTDLQTWQHVEGFPQIGTGAAMSFAFTPGTRGFFKFATSTLEDEFALIPAGSFQMGAQLVPEVASGRRVYVSTFYLARCETSKELWDKVRAWGVKNGYTDLPTGNGTRASKGVNHPVHSISWYDAVKWCNARSEMENLMPCYTDNGTTYKKTQNSSVACDWSANGYRLPTEAEWERAFRGGQTGLEFPWGNTISHSQANYRSNSLFLYDVSPTREYHPNYMLGDEPFSAPVNSFSPHGYGLYHMAGNMFEWCWDRWDSDYPPFAQTDPRGPVAGGARVFRSGCWEASAQGCRAASRYYSIPAPPNLSINIGFRVARSYEFALIPAGSFQMGNQTDPSDKIPDQIPVHSVNVSAFYMERYEVTMALWDEVREWGLVNGYTDLPEGQGKGVNHPVNRIKWSDMIKWCNARSQKAGLTPCYTASGSIIKTGDQEPDCDWSANGFRLPTEAEWEKAARGTLIGKRFPWGDTITHSRANYTSLSKYLYDESPTRGQHPTYMKAPSPYSSPVGSFEPNGYGLYDMAGNIMECCWDWYGADYYAASPGADPRGPVSGAKRICRGGSWLDNTIFARMQQRSYLGLATFANHIGFRTARSSIP